ncbi:MAG: hypothetical protein HOJ48_17340 [Desulfobacula sp.]|mgnify:CR=1 FL=1|jgi:hypothetical protein|nr:hypothetical protein [Desulfobacula sp.]
MKKMTTVVTGIFFVFCAVLSHAAETSLMVKLQNKIKGNIQEIVTVQSQREERDVDLNRKLKVVVDALIAEEDIEAKEQLGKEYYRLRAVSLQDHASATHITLETVIETVGDMKKLQESMQEKDRSTSPIAFTDKDMVGKTMGGIARQLETLQKLDPESPEVARLARTLEYQDARFRSLFTRSHQYSLSEQIDHLVDMAATLQASLNLMEERRKNLLQQVYYVVKGGIVHFTENLLYDLDKALPITLENNTSENDVTVQEELANSYKHTRYQRSTLRDLSRVGQY